MGIQDRDYYREDSGGWWSTVHGHRATWTLVAITVGVFLAQVATFHRVAGENQIVDAVKDWLGYSLPDILHGQVWRLAFTPFIQSSVNLVSVAFAMLLLYFAGTAVEELYGGKEFAAFYVLVGFAAALAKFLVGVAGFDLFPSSIGYGPSLSAVLVLYACHYPHRRIRIWFILPVPVWLLVALTVGLSVLGVSSGSFEPIPHLAAVAFAFGYYKLQRRITDLIPSGGTRSRKASRPKLRIVPESEETPEPVAATASPPVAKRANGSGKGLDEQLEAQLDQVLEKVTRYGRDSLTTEERDILQRASEVYRRRRGR